MHPTLVVPGEYLVKFRPRTSKARIDRALGKPGVRMGRSYRSIDGLRLVRLAEGATPQSEKLTPADNADIEYIEPNFVVRAHAMPNDPRFPEQWGLQNTGQIPEYRSDSDIDATEAWDLSTGDPAAIVAVVDTGIDYTHEDLAANIWRNNAECTGNGIDDDGNGYVDDCHGIDTVNGDSDPMDDQRHGTHVAGIIGAVGNNGIGIAGVAWRVRLLPCKFLDADGHGTTAAAVECLSYVLAVKRSGGHVVAVNNSWGGGADSRALTDVTRELRDAGVLVVASAGNDYGDNDPVPQYPCNTDLSNVICVASAHGSDGISLWSNIGRATVHVAAPGEDVLSTVPGNRYELLSGTSMAAPHVAGAVVLLAAHDPSRDWRMIRSLILATTDQPTVTPMLVVTKGRMNVRAAMTCTDRTLAARLLPVPIETLIRPIGAHVGLRAVNLRCDHGAGNVLVAASPAGAPIATLRDDGVSPDAVAGDGEYNGEWIAPAEGDYSLDFPAVMGASSSIRVDPFLKPGFPRAISASYDWQGVLQPGHYVLVGNVDADPQLEVLGGGYPVYAWKADGTDLVGWPLWDLDVGDAMSLAEFDGNPATHEIAAGGRLALNMSGTVLAGWPQFARAILPPAIIDIDGDGIDESIGYPARRADGSLVNPNRDVPASGPVPGSAAAADLDYDGRPDFVVAHQDIVWASNELGVLGGFPLVDRPPYWAGGASSSTPVVGDVDGDGALEIMTTAYWDTAPHGRIRIVSARGVLERALTTTDRVSDPVLADLTGDGIPEIIARTNDQVFAWTGDGRLVSGWPVSLGTDIVGDNAPVVGDLDGDGRPDIAVVAYVYDPFTFGRQVIRVFRHDGTPLPAWSREYRGRLFQRPAIADLDGDGRNELIVMRTVAEGRWDALFVFDSRAPGPYGPVEWGQFQEGPQHRGAYVTGKNLPNDAYLAVQHHGPGVIASADARISCGTGCLVRYPKGTTVRLSATAQPGARFERWLGACAGQGAECSVVVSGFTPVAADFAVALDVAIAGNGAGRVNSAPAGIACPGDCNDSFSPRSSVTLTATPAAGSIFDGWSGGSCSGTTLTCTLSFDVPTTVTAR
ncbi:MAG: S8 family serine peptidase [Steroidobacteraceae bacterium]